MPASNVIANEKAESVKRLQELFQKYPIFAIADLKGLKANQLQVLKKKFKDDLEIHVAKNTLVKRALKEVGGFKDLEGLEQYLKGSNAFVFSRKNPFFLYLMFEKNKVESAASPGDIAPNDITVSAGNTGLQPGPILSKFGSAKLQTKIQDGTIWIAKDTVVAEKGMQISADLADLLGKLGLKPIMVGLKLKMGYDGGIIPYDILAIDIETYRSNVADAARSAVNLAINAVFPTRETSAILIMKAFGEAKSVAVSAGVPIPEVLGEILSLAEIRGKALAKAVSERNKEIKF
uniref:Large ribosomal subunit protein uL10 n=1 Tax=Candidatus Methanomethylicus mesodigestus TaxID=1867258 RepID=A0A7C3IS85_9CREN